ncbi:MAG: hypothetical protein DRQ78_01295 [Epsilonproteobacteria bacterium]|nr:MAG: hypothetical protein DRQ78_01295 [Campylobacterota bacterium]
MNEKEFKLLEKQVIAEESKINRIELTIYSNENKIDKYASLISVSQKTKLKNQLIQLAKKIEKLNISSDKKILKTDSNATKKQIKHATGIKVRIIKVEIRKAKKQLAMMNAVNVTKLKKSIKDLKEQNVANAIEIAKLQSQAKPIFKQYTKAITLKKSKDLDIAISAKNVNA